ncbi:MAG: hypothetical protein K1X75_06185 [Leptospirales bacterium]|nr:hypothetical protein [Leptospirales bacterium]
MAEHRLQILVAIALMLGACAASAEAPVQAPSPQPASAADSSGGQSATAAVHALVSADSGYYQEALLGIESSLESELQVHYIDIQSAPAAAEALIDNLDRPGLILLPLGGAAAAFALQYAQQATVLAALAPSPNRLRELHQDLCGVSLPVPTDDYISALRELRPGARRIYVVYASQEGEFSALALRLHEDQQHLSLTWANAPSLARLRAQLAQAPEDIEAVFLPADPTFGRESFQALVEFSRSRGIPLMAGFAPLVRLGASFGYAPDAFHAGALSAQLANRILSGGNCAEEGMHPLDSAAYQLWINDEALEGIGIRAPDSLRLRAQSARAQRAGLDLYLEGRYEAARSVFAWAASVDPQNPALRRYLSLTVEKLSGRELQAERDRARQAQARGDLSGAESALRRALTLSPDNVELRGQLRQVQTELCERNRLRGRQTEASGRSIEALRIFAGGECMNADAARLRHSLRGEFDGILEQGLTSYHGRDYRGAIEKLEQALLIDPGSQNARAYLDLARKKLQALERLQRQQPVR